MLINEFIDKAFEKICAAFPLVSLQYQFDKRIGTHFIRVSPSYIYEGSSFTDLFWELDDMFTENFPDETLCFLTEDSLNQLDNPSKVRAPLWASLYQEVLILKNEPTQVGKVRISDDNKLVIGGETILPFSEGTIPDSYNYAMAA